MSMSPGKVISVGIFFMGALTADYIRTKLVGSYDFPENNESEADTEDQESDNPDNSESPSHPSN